eukprot:1380797-Prymnesium_polylepis.1
MSGPAGEQWYVWNNMRVTGPYDTQRMNHFCRTAAFGPHTQVRMAGWKDATRWVPLGSVSGFDIFFRPTESPRKRDLPDDTRTLLQPPSQVQRLLPTPPPLQPLPPPGPPPLATRVPMPPHLAQAFCGPRPPPGPPPQVPAAAQPPQPANSSNAPSVKATVRVRVEESPEEIAKWIEARKKKWPSAAVVALKEKLQEERETQGALAPGGRGAGGNGWGSGEPSPPQVPAAVQPLDKAQAQPTRTTQQPTWTPSPSSPPPPPASSPPPPLPPSPPPPPLLPSSPPPPPQLPPKPVPLRVSEAAGLVVTNQLQSMGCSEIDETKSKNATAGTESQAQVQPQPQPPQPPALPQLEPRPLPPSS